MNDIMRELLIGKRCPVTGVSILELRELPIAATTGLCKAKDYDGNWVFGYYVRQYGANELYTLCGERVHIDFDTLCRFTGTYDKKDNPIFQYDTYYEIVGDTTWVFVVDWYNNKWYVNGCTECGSTSTGTLLLTHMKIISGNIKG